MSLEKFKEEFKRLIIGNHPDSNIESLYNSINEWIPIEQAPKDTPILLLPEKEYGIIPVVGLSSSKWYNGGEFYLVDERGEAVYFDDGSYLTIFPTHFKYL